MWPTDDNGVTSFTSIFPGFYVRMHAHISVLETTKLTILQTNRAIHVHVQVHTDWTITSNGTIGGGRTVNTAQLFFNEDVATQVMAMPPYVYHTQIPRKPVSQDGVWYEESLSKHKHFCSRFISHAMLTLWSD